MSPSSGSVSGEFLVVQSLQRLARERAADVAIGDLSRTVTYGELEERIGAVAARIAEIGDVRPVVVFVDRSLESAIACMAVWWAGRCLVPIDVAEPESRLGNILDKIGQCHLIDPTGNVNPSVCGRKVVDVRAEAPRRIDPLPFDLDGPAMLLFTSGSTGEPKGVVRTGHQQNAEFSRWLSPPTFEGSRCLVFFPLHFLAGIGYGILWPASGLRATFVDLLRTSPDSFADLADSTGVDCLHLTPSMAHGFSAAFGGRRRLEGVRWVSSFGEPLDWSEVAMIRNFTAADVTIQIGYGASESTGRGLARYMIGPDAALGEGSVPLGYATDPTNLRFDPVDGSDVLRELVVVRDVVSGYWGDRALESTRFGVDDAGQPFWRSGDLVVVEPDGLMRLRGRADDMVKVNGRMVEPAEAERVLRSIPGIRHAVLLPRHLPSGRSQFVAHLEVDQATEPALTPDAVRTVLRRDLPTHLVPAVLVRHDAMPVNARGKVDRGMLRATAVTPWRVDRSDAASDAVVLGVAGLAASLLDIVDLGVDDDLWDMGCDSLGAIELAEAIRSAHGVALEPNDLIGARTPRALAELVQGTRHRDRGPVVVVNQNGTRHPIAFVAGGGGPAVQYHALALAFGPDQPVVVYEQLGLHQKGALDADLHGQVERCLADLCDRQPVGPYSLVGHSYGGLVAHEMARRLEECGERVAVALIDTHHDTSVLPAALVTGRHRSPVYLAASRLFNRALLPFARPGSHRRYRAMYLHTFGMVRRHRPGTIAGPVLVVGTAASLADLGWDDHHDVTRCEVGGDHVTMVQPPHASEIAIAASTLFERLR